MTKSLRESPSISSLKYEAKQILKLHKADDLSACETLRLHAKFAGKTNEQILATTVSLQEVQHALALEYGFDGWPALTEAVLDAAPAAMQITDTRINLLSIDHAVQGNAVPGSVLGIDIGSSQIKLLELSRQGPSLKVECFGIEPLPESVVVEANIVDVDAVAQALVRLVERCKPSTVDASLGITGSAVLYKTIEMPADLTDDQLETAIRDGADQYVPYPLNEIALAYEIKRRSPVNAGQLEVLLTACRKGNVSLRQTVLERAGLRAKVADIEAYCMDRVYRVMTESLGIGDDDVTAVFSVGATISQLFVMTRDRLPYCRDQLFGGLQLTQEIQRRYDLSFEQAESAKRASGLPDDYGNEVHRPWVETIVEQLSRQLDFIYESSPWDAVDHVILCGGVFCGGVGATTGLEDAVASALKLPTTIANPFTAMDLGSGVNGDLLSADAPAMMIACGLALRSVTTQRSDAIARDRSRTIRLPETVDDDTPDE